MAERVGSKPSSQLLKTTFLPRTQALTKTLTSNILQGILWSCLRGKRSYIIDLFGARGRTRTGKEITPRDFKSLASTNFATRAYSKKKIEAGVTTT